MIRVLVVNAGSSSLKLSLLGDSSTPLAEESLPADGAGLAEWLGALPTAPDAVGHRVVHGGTEFTSPVRLDAAVLSRLRALTDLAPLHQPKSLRGIDAVSEALPEIPAYACFDTAFHTTIPPAAATYALPAALRDRYGLRRFGFHGLSHAHAGRVAAERTGATRIVVAHLGAGASLCAIRDGRSIDTTMGFTPVEGLVMATRSGSVDPGMLLWLITHAGLDPAALSHDLEHASGLTGLAGTGDMRDLLARADPDARLAVDVYLHHLRSGIAAMTASLGGLDALVFTGGVGEHAPEIRARAAAGLHHLGLAIDPSRNATAEPPLTDISAPEALVAALVVTAREDLEIATAIRRELRDQGVEGIIGA